MEEKNPFSLYDFLGYLFPGIFTILLFFIVRQSVVNPNYTLFDCLHIHVISAIIQNFTKVNWYVATVVFVVFSYITGHIIAFLSSITIEYLSCTMFDYPSFFLLGKVTNSPWVNFKNCSGVVKICCRWLVLFFMWPIGLIIFLYPSIKDYIQKPLPTYLIDGINKKTEMLYNQLRIDVDKNDEEVMKDFHRVIMHYVYLRVPGHKNKADNYIALYGFLRSICFVTMLFFDVVAFCALYTLRYICMDFNGCKVNWFILFVFTIGFLASIILYFAFMKFYRKFTLENFMALLTCDLKDVEIKDERSFTSKIKAFVFGCHH